MSQASPGTTPNRLAKETSPYLQQHAYNPVDWYPWGPEALERAQQEDKPILLSIGYSACHWCHVMAHESFEDEATARLMNELFVNIKVDREERPDIDRIYQIAQQLITQRSGGWPLTMFLTPEDQRPFFGGTYFPKQARYGMPAFTDVLKRVSEYFQQNRAELRSHTDSLMQAFADMIPPAPQADLQLNAAPLQACRARLGQVFDSNYGGFGSAPKFPHPKSIERCFRDWYASAGQEKPDLQALFMATLTLKRMADGGIHDQLGGGFSRYSVDGHWMIPHFEKMLYDNGALLSVYAEAALATGDRFFASVASDTADWIIRELQSPEGGYYSSLDADSEGQEGKYYVWTPDEVRAALTPEEYAVFAPRFGLDRKPNFEGKWWHLHVFRLVEQVAGTARVSFDRATELLESARRKLLAVRDKRVRPARDEKILTAWNATAIRGMAVAARSLGREDLATSATRALDFIRSTLWRDGRLLATYKDGRAHLNAYLDDYVYLADAVLELQQVRFRNDELLFARDLLDVVLARFRDPDGGFFFTSDDHEALIHRTKTFGDDALPSGNGIAAFAFQRMGQVLAEPKYLEAAEQTLRAGWRVLERFPQGHVSLLHALEEVLNPPTIVILRGAADDIGQWQKDLARLYNPHRVILAIPDDTAGLAPALADKTPRGRAVAYVCKASTCSPPIEAFSELVEHLREKTPPLR